MRLKYALKFWLIIFLLGFIGIFLFSFWLNNPGSVEMSAYGEEPRPWYQVLFDTVIGLLPYLFFITLVFLPLGFVLYHPKTSASNKNTTITSASLKNKVMLPAYILTLLTLISPFLIGSLFSFSGVDGLLFGAMIVLLLFILIPINIGVWIICIRHTRSI